MHTTPPSPPLPIAVVAGAVARSSLTSSVVWNRARGERPAEVILIILIALKNLLTLINSKAEGRSTGGNGYCI
jgi:hypothetical protein